MTDTNLTIPERVLRVIRNYQVDLVWSNEQEMYEVLGYSESRYAECLGELEDEFSHNIPDEVAITWYSIQDTIDYFEAL